MWEYAPKVYIKKIAECRYTIYVHITLGCQSKKISNLKLDCLT